MRQETYTNIAGLLALLAVLLFCGCKNDETLGDWFKQTQADTETPHGPIDGDSVQTDGDAVIYETGDGGPFIQIYEPDADGGFERVGDPRPYEG